MGMMKMGGAPVVVAILVSFYMAASASAEGAQGSAQIEVYGARKDLAEVYTTDVRGSVSCDRCILGRLAFPFVGSMKDVKVSVQCKDAKGKVTKYARSSTNFWGDFTVSFKGRQELKGCAAYLSGSPNRCNILGAVSRTTVRLQAKFPLKAVYVVDPMFYRPAKPTGVCPGKRWAIRVPFPNTRPSTCSYLKWVNPIYKCYWPKDMASLKTTVVSVFGRIAQRKYGSMTLEGGLLSGDPLLREAIAAMLNARTNLHFYMSPGDVKSRFTKALQGSSQAKNAQAWAFFEANGKDKCLLVPCKQ